MDKRFLPSLLDGDKGRIFEAIQYDDSCPLEDVIFYCTSRAIPVVISPLHDRDRFSPHDIEVHDLEYPDEVGKYIVGQIKKAHRHVLFCFLGYKSGKQIKEMCKDLGLVRPVLMHDKVQRMRYLCHFDESELDSEGFPYKPFYDPMEVRVVGNINYEHECEKAIDDMPVLKEIEAFVRQEHILSFADLKDYCAVNNPVWYEAITKRNTLSMLSYLKSLAYKPKLESIELEYQVKQLHDEVERLSKKRDKLLADEAKKAKK